MRDRDEVRWHDLVRFSLKWALYRRPTPERDQLIAAAQSSQTSVARQREVQTVSMMIAEALKAEGQLNQARLMLQGLLEEKFGAVPEPVRQRIQTTTDLTKLDAAARRVLHLDSLEEFEL